MNVENSAKALVIRDSKILLIKNRDVADLGEWYSLPGGRQNPGETLESAVVREVREETGYEVSVGALFAVREYIHSNHELRGFGKPSHKIEFMFTCNLKDVHDVGPSVTTISDDEQVDVIWMNLDDFRRCNVLPRRLRKGIFEIDTSSCAYWGDILFEE